jgi:hypothetical protein
MIDWARVEGRAWAAPTFSDEQVAAGVAAAKALPAVDDDPNHVALFWQIGDKYPDISEIDLGDAFQQITPLASLLAATDHAWLNRQKLIAHVAARAAPVRLNPFTAEPLVCQKRKGDLLIVDGHHRLGALTLLGASKWQLWIVPTSAAVKAMAPQ